MTDIEIVQAYWNISPERRKEIRERIVADAKKSEEDEIRKYLDAMKVLQGYDFDLKSRKRERVDERKVLALVLYEKEFSKLKIGAFLLRSPASVHLYIDELSFYLEKGLKNSTTKLYHQFKKCLKEYGI